jgi:oligosaccharide repeat unit polymerase
MTIAILIAWLALLTVGNYWCKRSVLYPPFLFCGVWLMVFVLYSLQIVETDPLHATVIFLIAAGALLFSLGGCIALLIPSPIVTTRVLLWPRSQKPTRDGFMKFVYFGVMVFSMFMVAQHTISSGLSRGDLSAVLQNARAAGVEGTDTGGSFLLAYMPAWTIYTAALFAVERRNRLFWLTAAVAFITAIFTTGRGPILSLFGSVTTVLLVETQRTRFVQAFKLARIPILTFFCLYVGLIFTTKDLSNMSGGAVSIATYFVVSYFVGPVAALDSVIEHPGLYTGEPNHTFKFPLSIAARLHLVRYDPPPPLDSYVSVPFPTNVYTGYKFFFTDFGLFITLAIALLIGFLHTLLFRKATQRDAEGQIRSELGLYCFACSVITVLMFIFDDLYSALGVNLTILLFGSIYFATRHVSPLGAARLRIPPAMKKTLLRRVLG